MTAPATTSLELDTETSSRLQRLAETRRRSADGLIREAVEQYLEREEQRERLHRDAFAAWEAYCATGEHLTAEEVDEWLARLQAGEDVDPPSPHK
jgi:predicted transcriptional regulator